MRLSFGGGVGETRHMKLEQGTCTPPPGLLAFWARALSKAFCDTFSQTEGVAPHIRASTWESMVAAASEELGDDEKEDAFWL